VVEIVKTSVTVLAFVDERALYVSCTIAIYVERQDELRRRHDYNTRGAAFCEWRITKHHENYDYN